MFTTWAAYSTTRLRMTLTGHLAGESPKSRHVQVWLRATGRRQGPGRGTTRPRGDEPAVERRSTSAVDPPARQLRQISPQVARASSNPRSAKPLGAQRWNNTAHWNGVQV